MLIGFLLNGHKKLFLVSWIKHLEAVYDNLNNKEV